MPILKPSKETAEQFKDWLIFSPNVSRQSTKDTPEPQDSAKKPSQDSQPEPKRR